MNDQAYVKLMQRLGYQFKELDLLRRALTHRSHQDKNNERLEFLGDAILGMVVGDELFHRYPKAREGELSRMRSSLVSGEVLAELAQELQLQDYIRLGMGEEKSGGRQRPSILSDVVEAIIAAIYLDGGLGQARACVLGWHQKRMTHLVSGEAVKDAKSQLQEWLQARHMPLPHYESTVSGAAHQQTFKVNCQVKGMSIQAQGVSSSRRKAEQMAALHFLEKLNESAN